jgi:branched-chain amino acid transport system permease protein
MIFRLGLGIAAGAALVILPFVASSVWQNLLITTFYFAYLGQAWNILGGYAGQLSLGHAAFFAIGAYTSVVLHTHLGLSPWLGCSPAPSWRRSSARGSASSASPSGPPG